MLRRAWIVPFFAVPFLSFLAFQGGQRESAPPSRASSIASDPDAALATSGLPSGEAVQNRVSPATGAFSFLRASGGGVLGTDDASQAPEARALEFLRNHGALTGMPDAARAALGTDASTLELMRVDEDDLGQRHVRFRQILEGIPVLGGELVVHLDDRGVLGVNGAYVPTAGVPTAPRLEQKEAIALAAQSAGEPVDALAANLMIFREGLLENAPGPTTLAWAVDVAGATVHERVIVDAIAGLVQMRYPLSHRSLDRIVYSPDYDPDHPDQNVQRREGDAPSLLPPVNNLYDFAGQTYSYYASAFGRDSYDGQGITMRSVYLVNGNCPNAYWNGSSTNYCPGFDLDDVVSHEWSHAYTQFTHGLIYAYQSGALNEAYSDIFGEGVDLLNGVDGIGGANNDEPYPNGQRWLVGEDLGQVVQELLLRDMWDPERLGYPAKVSSPNYHCRTSDGGGVHTNSSVPNHAFAMLVDGKTFNGQTVGAIGLTKASAIYFRAESVYQTPVSDFVDHADALTASCSDLVGAPLTEVSTTSPIRMPSSEVITAADCEQVAKAMLAVEMRSPPTQCGFTPMLAKNPPARCNGVNLLTEGFESGDGGWTKESVGLFADWPGFNWTVRGSLPENRAGNAAFAVNDRGGTCAPGGEWSGVFSTSSPAFTATANVQVRFDHYMESELGYDGGNVLYSLNGGSWTLVPQNAYLYNAAKTRLNRAPPLGQNTNPKAGQFAWHGADGGQVTSSWGTSVISLASIAAPGDSVRLRWEMGQDGCNGVTGWFVDDVTIDDCAQTGVAPTASFTASPDPATEGQAVAFDGSASSDPDGGAIVSWTWSFGDGSENVTTQTATTTHVYDAAGTYTVALTVVDDDGQSATMTRSLEVKAAAVALPDLRVTSIILTSIKHGARITATVVNEGNAPAPSTRTGFRLDGTELLGSVSTASLAPGESVQVSVDFDARGKNGSHELVVTADETHAATESDETDNASSRTLSVQGTKVK